MADIVVGGWWLAVAGGGGGRRICTRSGTCPELKSLFALHIPTVRKRRLMLPPSMKLTRPRPIELLFRIHWYVHSMPTSGSIGALKQARFIPPPLYFPFSIAGTPRFGNCRRLLATPSHVIFIHLAMGLKLEGEHRGYVDLDGPPGFDLSISDLCLALKTKLARAVHSPGLVPLSAPLALRRFPYELIWILLP